MSRRVHSLIGIILVLPMLVWGATGLVFFYKPGYSDAYAGLAIKQYPLPETLTIEPQAAWRNTRVIQSVLGTHLIASDENKNLHLDLLTMQPMPAPTELQLRTLINDAISSNKKRYGDIEHVEGSKVLTTTGVELNLNWDTLSLTQSGRDTALINRLYKLHYLQWTPFDRFNSVIGFIGIIMIFSLTMLGFYLFLKPRVLK